MITTADRVRPYYITEWSHDPKADFVFDLAVDEGIWDPRQYDGSFGSCDLIWYPGWLLPRGWPNMGYSFWPVRT